MNDPRYPIGTFTLEGAIDAVQREKWISEIAAQPAKLRDAVAGLSDAQLDTPYRNGGWTLRQVVHHVPDSHMNGYVRFKLALTENNPTIKPYLEHEWAKLPDSTLPLEMSLKLFEAIHERWTKLLQHMTDVDFERTYVNPESRKQWLLKEAIGLYAWHGNHHIAHITELRKRKNW
ncbi:MAG: YfiT family bacillithiol transferase [Trueperaceae bacterium]